MPLKTIEAQTGENPVATIIIMHGLGASADDFVPVSQEWDLSSVGAIRYVFPNAPIMPITINGGYEMPAWYDILNLNEPRLEDEAGLRKSQGDIEALIGKEIARGIPAKRIVIAGFSQGCAMSLMAGLRYKERLGGILGMSGYLPLASKTATERSDANQLTPIFLAHGTRDPMIAIPRARASRDALQAMGYHIDWKEYPMEHSVCPQEIRDMEHWLRRILG